MNQGKLITAIFLCLVYAGTSWGAEVSLFEQDFLRNKGKKDKYEETFSASEGEGRLIISNGDEDGKNRIKRAAVFLNGKKIKAKLTRKKTQREIPVNLLAENTLSVKLAGKRQGHLKVQVVQHIDTDASSSVDVTLFDKEYLRSKGRLDAFQDSFVGQAGGAKLIVRGIGESGKKKMWITSISLNGKKISRPRPLVMKGNQQEFTVNLLEENSISVKLLGKPGRGLQVQVVQEVEAAAAAVVGPEGGVVAVEDTASPIYGAKIEVPAGALDEAIVLTMNLTEAKDELPDDMILAGPAIDLGPEGTRFKKNILITTPYFDDDNDGYIDGTELSENNIASIIWNDNGVLLIEYLDTLEQDNSKNYITGAASHFTKIVTTPKDEIKNCSMAVEEEEGIVGIDGQPGTAFDAVVSLYYDPREDDPDGKRTEHYQKAIEYWADAVCEQTNGAHRLRNVRIFVDHEIDKRFVDVYWTENAVGANQPRPNANLNGFGYRGDEFLINMLGMNYDGKLSSTKGPLDMQSGYTLGHEWGHYTYGLHDEYLENDSKKCTNSRPCHPGEGIDEAYPDSIMNGGEDAAMYKIDPITEKNTATAENYKWLNHSSGSYISPNSNETYRTIQGYIYGKSSWEVMTMDTIELSDLNPALELNDTSRTEMLEALERRTHYKTLDSRKPLENEIALELFNETENQINQTNQDSCRELLTIIWVPKGTEMLCRYPFPDIKVTDPYRNSLDELWNRDFIDGYPDGNFLKKMPDGTVKEKINRAEFSKMLVNAAEAIGISFDGNEKKEFTDVSSNDWFEKFVVKLSSVKILEGYKDGTFRPADEINMVEMLKIITLTFACTEEKREELIIKQDRIEQEEQEEWYANYLRAACRENIRPINVAKKVFRCVSDSEAGEIVSRKQAAKAIYEAYSQYKRKECSSSK